VLDAVQPRVDERARVENLEVSGARDVMRSADVDHRLRARERKAEVDFQRRRAVRHVDLGLATRLLRIARDDRVRRIRGMLAVDVRPGRENPRPGKSVGRDHPPQLDELVVPLPGITKRCDTVTELPQRQLRVVLDVEVQVDEAGDDRLASQIDPLGVRGNRDGVHGAGILNALAPDDDRSALDRRPAPPVDDADVLEDEQALLGAGRSRDSEGQSNQGGMLQ
jgi:hypothetical protein